MAGNSTTTESRGSNNSLSYLSYRSSAVESPQEGRELIYVPGKIVFGHSSAAATSIGDPFVSRGGRGNSIVPNAPRTVVTVTEQKRALAVAAFAHYLHAQPEDTGRFPKHPILSDYVTIPA